MTQKQRLNDIKEFIKYLEGNKLKKNIGSMVNPVDHSMRDILGHYAKFAGIGCQPGDTIFLVAGEKRRGPTLPQDHWLLEKNSRGYTIASCLADINDTREGFGDAIRFLNVILTK